MKGFVVVIVIVIIIVVVVVGVEERSTNHPLISSKNKQGTADFTNCHFWIFDEFFMSDGDHSALSSSPTSSSSLLASPSSSAASSRGRAPHFREIEKTFLSALPSSSSGVPSFIHSSFSHYVNNNGDLEKTTESFVIVVIVYLFVL